jgi:hypothetical protein
MVVQRRGGRECAAERSDGVGGARSAATARRKGRCSRGGRRKPTASIIPFQVLQVDARRFYHLAQHGLVQDPGAADPAEEGLGMEVRGGGRAWGWW